MILHDLLSTLKTSVYRCMLLSPGSCDMPVTTWLERPTLRDGRCVKKFSDLLCLTECRFYGHLEEDAHLYPNLSMKSRLAQLDNGHFSKLLKLQNETHKKQERSFISCHVALETMSVELHGRSHPAHNAARMVHYTEHRPFGCQGMKS